ncbi:methyl-accepting chemotaxis protein [Undibacterium sp.]|uniref:methyl-accepting chemotaxis protein n=1 Tax=Undibacterium sp. TaxID=1914977 RepID=UPI0025DE5963|nr:methyl-accepting chemotaxis protein [Undibacterium sp.]
MPPNIKDLIARICASSMPKSRDELINRVMHPCSVLMSKLSLRTKLLCMFGTFIAAIILLGAYTVSNQNTDLNTAKSESQGVELSRQIMLVLIQTQKHRGLVNLKLSGQDTDASLKTLRSELNKSLNQLDTAIELYSEFALANPWKATADELRQLASGKIASNSADNLAQHSRLIAQILSFSNLNNETSGLLFDPVASSYLLMDVAIQKIPVWIENLAILRGMGAGFIKSGNIDFSGKATLISRLDGLRNAIAAATEMDAALKRAGETMSAEQQLALKASTDFAATVRKNLLGENIEGDASAYFAQASLAIEKTVLLQTHLQNRLNSILSERISALTLQRNLTIFIMLAALFATAYLVFGFYRSFISAMADVGASALSVAKGDLTKQVHIDGKDELAQTGDALEKMNLNLSALVANVRTNSSMVSQLGQILAVGISDMAIRTEQQASSLEQTSASVEDLAATVKKNADSAKSADNLASNVRLIAESSGDIMHAAVESMQGIHTSANKMQEIVSMIDRIAFQTDILALNAAVEASHAGTHGLGFAVVANEVRALAQRTADAARQIRRLIDDAVSKVETGVEQINEVNLTLADIVSGIRNLASNTNSISTASADQSNGLAQISEAIRHLDEITQSNGKMAEEAKHASIDLETRALALTEAVSMFRLRQGTADEAHALVKKATALFHVNGMSTLQRITDDYDHVFADRDMYVFAFNRDGQYLAFAGNAAKLEVNLMTVSGLDGRKLVEDAFALGAVGGWVDYTIVNPVTKKIETKTSYLEPISADIVVGCGVYKSA